eukprot:SAG11_NODE_5209_length_1630_cov_1.399086_1_plen_66_part_10
MQKDLDDLDLTNKELIAIRLYTGGWRIVSCEFTTLLRARGGAAGRPDPPNPLRFCAVLCVFMHKNG